MLLITDTNGRRKRTTRKSKHGDIFASGHTFRTVFESELYSGRYLFKIIEIRKSIGLSKYDGWNSFYLFGFASGNQAELLLPAPTSLQAASSSFIPLLDR